MATPEPALTEPQNNMTPLEYLKQADKEMAAGNHQVAAGLLWKATESTFIGLAEKLGMDGNDFREVAKAMEKKNPPYELYYSGNLLFAESLRDHDQYGPNGRVRVGSTTSTGQRLVKRRRPRIHPGVPSMVGPNRPGPALAAKHHGSLLQGLPASGSIDAGTGGP